MNMLTILLGNLRHASRTRAPTDPPPVPPAFRGALAHDPARCTACGICAVVCAPNAIRFEPDPSRSVTWLFYLGRCSFCGLCMQNCPTQAITMEAASARAIPGGAGGGPALASAVRFTPCPRCGRPHIPLPDAESALCPECRQQAAASGLRRAFLTDREATHGP
jgi:hydrogenase-4 component H